MKVLYFTLCIIMLIGCSSEDSDIAPIEDQESLSLEGEWNLVNISGGFQGIDQDFERGIIIWDFDESSQMVTITNNSMLEEEIYDGFPSGTFPFSIIAPDDIDELIVNDQNLGIFVLESRRFSVSELFSDGFQIRFER